MAISPQSVYYLSSHLPGLLEKSGFVTTLYDQSLRAFLSRLSYKSDVLISFSIIMLLIILVIWNYFRRKSSLRNLIFFSQILLVTTIGNSFAWQHHFVLTFPAFIAASKIIYEKRSQTLFLIILLSALLVGYHIPDLSHPLSTNPFFVSHTLIGALILFGILFFG